MPVIPPASLSLSSFEYLSADRHSNIAFYSIRIFVNNEYQHSCSNMERNLELFYLHPFHGKEMQNKNKNNRKVTKLPTAKLIEIAVANCKKMSHFRDRIDVLCTKALPIFPD